MLVLCILLLLLVLVPGVGKSVNGNQNWIDLGGSFTLQPSEGAKLALVLWGADLLARRARQGRIEWRQMLIPLMPGIAILAVLVMLGRDLGTTLVLFMIFLALLWVVGAPIKLFGGIMALAMLAAVIMIKVEPYRMARIGAFLDPWADAQNAGYQAVQGQIAMGSGGWFGLGLGASRQKWSWLPHGESDFIFAILGEELGLPGTLVLLALFCALALVCYRIVLRSTDLFVRVATAGVMAWVVCQAIINIGAVVGLLPVIGVPLPLVSYGGSSLMTTMFALGMLLSFARQEPGCLEALSAKPSLVRRSLAVLPVGRGRR
jgi:cell division protein FtsW